MSPKTSWSSASYHLASHFRRRRTACSKEPFGVKSRVHGDSRGVSGVSIPSPSGGSSLQGRRALSRGKAAMESAFVSLNNSIVNPMAAMEARSHTYAHKSLSQATHRAYESDWSQFAAWCEERNLNPMPAAVETIVLWLSGTADKYRPTTLERKIASISKAHQSIGHESPTWTPIVHTVLRGIRRHKRECGEPVAPQRKAPILARHLRAIVEVIPDTLAWRRPDVSPDRPPCFLPTPLRRFGIL